MATPNDSGSARRAAAAARMAALGKAYELKRHIQELVDLGEYGAASGPAALEMMEDVISYLRPDEGLRLVAP
jgi:hypothetical protein